MKTRLKCGMRNAECGIKKKCGILSLLLLIAFSASLAVRAADPAWADPSALPPPSGAIGYPSRAPGLDARPGFAAPPAGYAQVPFWWWIGDPLTKERIAWQLDLLQGTASGLQVNYCHTDRGGRSYGLTFPSDPPLFSEPWWSLFGWTMQEAKKRGMALSLSDYTLGIPGQGYWIDEILKDHPGLIGHTLARIEKRVAGGASLQLELPEGLLSVGAFPASRFSAGGPGVDLASAVDGRTLRWTAPAGNWLVLAVYDKPVPLSIDPMNPLTGPEVIRTFFGRFEARNPGEAGKGLNFFFSDELNFGVGGQLWNARFAGEFQKRKGYDVRPELAALFIDVGPRTPKIRLDYYDVLVALSEESYFRPVFQWHYERGMLYGCDHGGRGRNVVEFGDYFRTQRWTTGPGCDQPKLAHDLIKNKVASSIAHLYQRPRAWSEEFHSTGWDASTEAMTQATNENWVAGMNLLTLHGLYYTTHGGWWEWAPPDFHWRMPYWPHMKEWLKAYERLSYLLSQGVHVCDTAIMYPVSPIQAGTGGAYRRGRAGENNAVTVAFAAGQALFDRGIDFDFIDDDSLVRAAVGERELRVSGEHYRVLVLPSMSAIRQATLDKVLAFHRAGGIVVALGDLPQAGDRAGREDPQLAAAVKEIFTQKNSLRTGDYDPLAAAIEEEFPRDFKITDPRAEEKKITPHVLHRTIGAREVYMVTQVPRGYECFFRAQGQAELWDFWTGATRPIPIAFASAEGTLLHMPLGETEAQLIVFSPGKPMIESSAGILPASAVQAGSLRYETLALDGPWEFELVPTLDNRFGDFRLPVTESNKIIGAEARRFTYSEITSSSLGSRTASSAISPFRIPHSAFRISTTTYSYAPHFYKLGPLPATPETEDLNQVSRSLPPEVTWKPPLANGKLRRPAWEPYEFSMREGVWNEPGHEGYHGLKENVSDDFIMLGRKTASVARRNDVEFQPEPGGTRYYLWTRVVTERDCPAHILAGDYKPAALWIDGQRCPGLAVPFEIPAGGASLLLRYDMPGRGHFLIQADGAPPAATTAPLSMRWNSLPGVLRFDPAGAKLGGYRFTAPPGLRAMRFAAFARGVRAWVDGRPAPVTPGARRPDGATEFAVTIPDPPAPPAEVALVLEHVPGYPSGAAFPEPIRLECGQGTLAAGDWSKFGALECYSGGAWYRRGVTLTPEQARGRVVLNLGRVVATAEVRINGKKAGVRLASPWSLDVSSWVKPGANRIEILVYSTLANHYATIPTRYRGALTAGLLGPVTLESNHR